MTSIKNLWKQISIIRCWRIRCHSLKSKLLSSKKNYQHSTNSIRWLLSIFKTRYLSQRMRLQRKFWSKHGSMMLFSLPLLASWALTKSQTSKIGSKISVKHPQNNSKQTGKEISCSSIWGSNSSTSRMEECLMVWWMASTLILRINIQCEVIKIKNGLKNSLKIQDYVKALIQYNIIDVRMIYQIDFHF